MRKPWVAWLGLAVAFLLGVTAAILNGDPFTVVVFFLLGLPFAVVGALIATRLPDLSVGWLMLGTGIALGAGTATGAAVHLALSHSASATATGAFALVESLAFSAFFLLVISVLFLLPNGRLPSRRWRFVRVLLGVLAVCDLLLVVQPGAFPDWKEEGVQNPIGVGAAEGALGVVASAVVALTFALFFGAIISVAIRFRSARGVERAQLRWIVAAVVLTGAAWAAVAAVNIVVPTSHAADAMWGIAFASVGLIPIGIGLAVMRYRLYEIDRVISKTLLYASLTLVLGAVYVGLVLAGQAVSSSVAGSSNLSVAVSTLLVAALFLPVRSRLQRVVDRRFNRRRYDTQRTLESFGARLREQVDLGTLERDLHGVMTETMQPAHASVWLRVEAGR